MPNILVNGIDSLLGSYCAARWLQIPDARIWYLGNIRSPEEMTDLISHALFQVMSGAVAISRSEIGDRVRPAGADPDTEALRQIFFTGIDEAWFFTSSRSSAKQAKLRERLIAACSTIGTKEFNDVLFDDEHGDAPADSKNPVANKTSERASDSRFSQYFIPKNIKHRSFRMSLIAGGHPALGRNGGVLSGFLAGLHSFKTEIEERSPQYFDFQALRCFAPADGTLNVLPASIASELLLRIARNPRTAGSSFSIVSPRSTPFSALCERISMVYGVGLLPVEDFAELNAIDRAFHERACGLWDYFSGGEDLPFVEAYLAADLLPETEVFDDEAQVQLLESTRRNQDEARAAREQRIADLPGTLERKTIARDGSDLTYCVGGTAGPAVVLLNALGQGLEVWYRLIDRLIDQYRVIIWEPRGTVSPPPPFGLVDQVNDLGAVLQNEAIETCHLVGWCTGPKVAVDFYLRRPAAVRSMAFLNSTFKCDGSPEEFDTSYEKNLEFLCRRLIRKPAMATSIMNTFQARVEEPETDLLEATDGEWMSAKVLSLANAKVKSWVLAPFRNEETTLNYAHQLVDFWANDARPKARQVQVPVLLMSAEYDEIVTPATSGMGAELFPNAWHVDVPAATHYCLYDRPEFVAGLLDTFFKNPSDIPVHQRAQAALAVDR